ncbi:helix-turn-helix domain-containing protein [Mammaliicoccus sciuri]|uniref:helix-turn-helix domain-containing protein n=1 Tax=Mammaliicoccus sciuri TaxID=1296 RepID=UPI003F559859
MIKFNLKKMMKEKKITLKELSSKTGLSINTLSLLSTGKSKGIQFETLEKIIRTLDCSVKDLIILDDEFKFIEIIKIEKSQFGTFTFNKLQDDRLLHFKCTYKENDEDENTILISMLFSDEYVELSISGEFPIEFLKSGKYYYYSNSDRSKQFLDLNATFLKKIFVECFLEFDEVKNSVDFKRHTLAFNLIPYTGHIYTKKFKTEDDLFNDNFLPSDKQLNGLVFVESNGLKVSNEFYKDEEIKEDDI